ncbi:MAG: ATP-binding cassette domain-containing protein [Chloroflexota bacterium]
MRVELDQITKIFGKLRANNAISMTLEGGRIYAILGENGAGKSTLMKILSGYQPPDSGRILLDGTPVSFSTPADALNFGIGMLHQDPLDVPSLTVLENFMLGEPGGLLPRRKAARETLIAFAERFGFTLRPDAYVDGLTIGERQQLEIVRLLSRGAQVLILDEPTTGISADQKAALFGSLQRLAHTGGLTVILVSHKLEDVEVLCDEVVVLRQGQVVGQVMMPYPTDQLVTLMFGKALDRTPRQPFERQAQTKVLHVKALTVPDSRVALVDISLEVEAGEVIGMAGLDGSGQNAFLRACAGLQFGTAGEIRLADTDVTRWNYHDRAQLGVAYAPAGRLEEGLVTGLTLTEHVALTSPAGRRVNWKTATQETKARIAHYSIRGQPDSQIETLSGGNQQRTLLSLLPSTLKLLLLENPTRGLDVESARWVWQQLLERRATGTAILFTSPDLDEIVEYSDRIIVFFGGKARMLNDPSQTSLTELGQMIGGK